MIDPARAFAALREVPGLGRLVSRVPLRWAPSPRAYEGDLAIEGARRFAIVSTITDNFVGLGAAFVLSLRENLAIRDEVDLILLQSPEIAQLSAGNRAALGRLWPGLRTLDLDTSGYLNAENMTRYDAEGRPFRPELDAEILPSKRAAYVKLNVLRLAGYEKVLLMDSDLMVVDDFSELFGVDDDLAAVRVGPYRPDDAGEVVPRWALRGAFNSGVLLLGRPCRGEAPFRAALDVLDKRRDRRLRDQSALNHVLRRAGKRLLPHVYNHKLDAAAPDMLADASILRTAKILHFIGPAKWALKKPRNEGQPVYDHFHALQARTGLPFTLEG